MGAKPLPVEFGDVRNDGRNLRVSWHETHRQVIVSQWRNGMCVATTPLPLEELPRLTAFVAEVLYQAASATTGTAAPPPTAASLRRDLMAVVRRRLTPRLAPVIRLSDRRRGK